ncbi:uncharacterized protein LOC131889023 isoform X2 [Tigriopus californicus]|uniref:uncharacterized protein LOC131889023 isoform X2 n=1 Tax=Tigriopus californicus TaxID=6832 RepID=UPI0027DA0083|nr:uncharacterized protein LOC131889023 isoform X2 [Tigriopus californicus]
MLALIQAQRNGCTLTLCNIVVPACPNECNQSVPVRPMAQMGLWVHHCQPTTGAHDSVAIASLPSSASVPPTLLSNPCCVVGCRKIKSLHAARNIYFYRFPLKDADRTAAWTRAIGQTNDDGTPWQPKSASRICSFHFVGEAKVDDPLSPAYIPTIFPTEEEELEEEELESLEMDEPVDNPTTITSEPKPQKELSKLGDLKKLDEIDWLETKAEPVFFWDDGPKMVDQCTQTTEDFEAPDSFTWICQRRAVFEDISIHSTMVSIPSWGAQPFPTPTEKKPKPVDQIVCVENSQQNH